MATSSAPAPDAPMAGTRRRWLRAAAPAVGVAAVVVLAVVMRERLARALDTLADVRWEWLVLAVVAEAASMGGLARQQRRLLRAGGGNAPLSAVIATTYAGNTISVGLPVAGPAAGTLYTFRRLRELGNEPAVVTWVLAVSGVFSTVAFALVVSVGAGMVGRTAGVIGAVVAGLVAVAPGLAFVAASRSATARARLVGGLRSLGRWAGRRTSLSGAVARTEEAAVGFVRHLGQQRVSPADGAAAFGWSLVNWLADVACLAFALEAVGADVPWQGLLLAWAAGAGAATLGLTPGGIGVVEAALTAALVGVTVPLDDAVPAVLVYRFISLWLVLAVGAVLLALPHRAPRSRVVDRERGTAG